MVRCLQVKDVALIHFMMMKKYGEGEHAGIKDQNLLESAVYRPRPTIFEEDAYPSLFEKAAALFESLARNHCFYNGNKRTALASVDIFLKKNGYKIKLDPIEVEEFTVLIAQGNAGSIKEVAQWLEKYTETCH